MPKFTKKQGKQIKNLLRPKKKVYKHPIHRVIFDGVEHIRNRTAKPPYGYKHSEVHKGYLEPIPLEIEAIKMAKQYRMRRCSYDTLSVWLTEATGRPISPLGVKMVLERGY